MTFCLSFAKNSPTVLLLQSNGWKSGYVHFWDGDGICLVVFGWGRVIHCMATWVKLVIPSIDAAFFLLPCVVVFCYILEYGHVWELGKSYFVLCLNFIVRVKFDAMNE